MKKLSLLLVLVLIFATVPAVAEFNETGLPIWSGETPFEFSLMIDDSYDGERVIYNILEEQTNVHVNLNLAPYQVQKEKMNIALNTGDYDQVIAGWLLDAKDIMDLGMNGDGTFWALEEYIAKYCPNIEKVLNIPGVRDSMTLPDGHIYTIPYVVSEPEVTFKAYINQVWLENLGLEMPTTTEEFKNVLIAFRDQDANGNGDPTDEIPFSGDTNNLNLPMLAGWFGLDASQVGECPYFTKKDGKLYFAANKPEFRQFIEYFADLYAEGLIDPELFTQDLENWKAKGKNDLYGVSIAYGPGDFYDNYEKGTPEYEKYGENAFTFLPVLKGCENPVQHRYTNGVSLFRSQLAITDAADEETMIIILRWIDNLFEVDNSVQSQQGPLGVKLEKAGDQLYSFIPHTIGEDGWTQEMDDANGWALCFTQSMPRYYGDAKYLNADGTEPDPSIMDLADEALQPYMNETFKEVWTDDEDMAARLSILKTDINDYIKSRIALWISGEANVAEDWDAYVAQLETYGLQELTEIYANNQGLEIHEDN